jgi:8-oxo-dGTP diphosphatase
MTDASGSARSRIQVVAAVLYDDLGRVLITERPPGSHMAGRWEFPGGKRNPGEPAGDALARELHEELGIEVLATHPFRQLQHAYADRDVELALWIVERYAGTPRGVEAQRLKWVRPAALAEEDILEADRAFVEALRKRAAPAR